MLPLEAAVQYGLLTPRTCEATDLARKLSALSGARLYEEFARHILLHCGGERVVQAVRQMVADGHKVTGDSLARHLTDSGFPVPVHNTAINSMRMWLAKAGVFPETGRIWEVNTSALERIRGLTDLQLQILAGLNDEQRAFVLALCRIAPRDWCRASEVRDLAEVTSGLRLSRTSLPKNFLDPLREAGLIEYRSGGTASGKSAVLRCTDRFHREVLEPFIRETVKTLDPVLAGYYEKRPEDIYADLDSKDRHRKGMALEAYAIHIMRLLGLRLEEWRKRGDDTGGAEVDATLSGVIGLIPTRWQVQCKNTPGGQVDLEDVAREVGVAHSTGARYILIVANCRITDAARRYASEINRRGDHVIFLLDRDDFDRIRKSPGSIGEILRDQARRIARSNGGHGVL